jgi:phosphoglycerate dehydrogenase-like enzyme
VLLNFEHRDAIDAHALLAALDAQALAGAALDVMSPRSVLNVKSELVRDVYSASLRVDD